MKSEEAINQIEELMTIDNTALVYLPDFRDAFELAVEALMDNKPSRTWIAKNEYRRGWHDALIKALSESMKIHVENETFDMVQKETLIGLGLSMDSALGAEPYSETDESYPEPDRPHGEWKEFTVSTYRGTDEWGEPKWGKGKKCICSRCGRRTVIRENFCPNCGASMRKEGEAE